MSRNTLSSSVASLWSKLSACLSKQFVFFVCVESLIVCTDTASVTHTQGSIDPKRTRHHIAANECVHLPYAFAFCIATIVFTMLTQKKREKEKDLCFWVDHAAHHICMLCSNQRCIKCVTLGVLHLSNFMFWIQTSAANQWEWNNNNNKCQNLWTTTRKLYHTQAFTHARSVRLHTPFGRSVGRSPSVHHTKRALSIKRITPTSSFFFFVFLQRQNNVLILTWTRTTGKSTLFLPF